MAVLAERIMRYLADNGAAYTRQLCAALDASNGGVRQACRCLRRHGLVHSEDNIHGLTARGRELATSGGWVPCQRAGRSATSEGRTLRQRAWTVLRMANMVSVPDLLRTLCEGDEKGAEDNLANYCRALHRAGLLGKTARTGAYFLRPQGNTGELAPAYNRAEKTVTDRNTGEVYNIGGEAHA